MNLHTAWDGTQKMIESIIKLITAIIEYLRERNIPFKKVSLGLILIFVISIIGFWSWKKYNRIYIKIISPVNGQIVNQIETIRGTYRNVPSDFRIWIVVYSHSDRVFYPHQSHAIITNQGNWVSYNVNIGSSVDSGEEFDIIALLVDNKAQEKFEQCNSRLIGCWLNILPNGTKEFDEITVQRK